MPKFAKLLIIGLIVLGVLWGVYSFATLGASWFEHASFITIGLAILGVLAAVYVGYLFCRFIWRLPSKINIDDL